MFARTRSGDPQGLFLALTLVVMIIIVLVTKDLTAAILIIGLATNYLIISTQLTALGRQQKARAPPPAAEPENFWPAPGAGAPYTGTTAATGGGGPWRGVRAPYRGAIAGDPDAGGPGVHAAAARGHPDRTARETDSVPVGNPHDLDRIGSPAAAAPCVDDEAAGGPLDGDELLAVQARSRNDDTRVRAGTIRRKAFMERFLTEELEEEEDSRWWGRHEE